MNGDVHTSNGALGLEASPEQYAAGLVDAGDDQDWRVFAPTPQTPENTDATPQPATREDEERRPRGLLRSLSGRGKSFRKGAGDTPDKGASGTWPRTKSGGITHVSDTDEGVVTDLTWEEPGPALPAAGRSTSWRESRTSDEVSSPKKKRSFILSRSAGRADENQVPGPTDHVNFSDMIDSSDEPSPVERAADIVLEDASNPPPRQRPPKHKSRDKRHRRGASGPLVAEDDVAKRASVYVDVGERLTPRVDAPLTAPAAPLHPHQNVGTSRSSSPRSSPKVRGCSAGIMGSFLQKNRTGGFPQSPNLTGRARLKRRESSGSGAPGGAVLEALARRTSCMGSRKGHRRKSLPSPGWMSEIILPDVKVSRELRVAAGAEGSEGFFGTIGEAMSAADAGDNIVVMPGCYEETVYMDKAVCLTGRGAVGAVVIKAVDSPALIVCASSGFVTNFTLLNSASVRESALPQGSLDPPGKTWSPSFKVSPDPLEGVLAEGLAGDDFSLDSAPSRRRSMLSHRQSATEFQTSPHMIPPEFEDEEPPCLDIRGNTKITVANCDVQSFCGPCVTVSDRANPTLRHNRIHNGARGGLVVTGVGTMGRYEHNAVLNVAQLPGVVVMDRAEVYMENNEVTECSQGGVLFGFRGMGVFTEGLVSSCAQFGVRVCCGSDAHVKYSTIERCETGVEVCHAGLGKYENLDIHGVGGTCIRAESHANPIVIECDVKGGMVGLAVEGKETEGVFERNFFTEQENAVVIRSEANPRVVMSEINSCQTAVTVDATGRGVIRDNNITMFSNAGLSVEYGSCPTFWRNKVHNSSGHGVVVRGGGSEWKHDGQVGFIHKNRFYKNARGVSIGWEGASDEKNFVRRNGYTETYAKSEFDHPVRMGAADPSPPGDNGSCRTNQQCTIS